MMLNFETDLSDLVDVLSREPNLDFVAEFEIEIHRLKGSALTLGFTRISQLLAQLEFVGKSILIDECEPIIREIVEAIVAIEKVRNELKNH